MKREIEREMPELNEPFSAFLRTKGIKAKYTVSVTEE